MSARQLVNLCVCVRIMFCQSVNHKGNRFRLSDISNVQRPTRRVKISLNHVCRVVVDSSLLFYFQIGRSHVLVLVGRRRRRVWRHQGHGFRRSRGR